MTYFTMAVVVRGKERIKHTGQVPEQSLAHLAGPNMGVPETVSNFTEFLRRTVAPQVWNVCAIDFPVLYSWVSELKCGLLHADRSTTADSPDSVGWASISRIECDKCS